MIAPPLSNISFVPKSHFDTLASPFDSIASPFDYIQSNTDDYSNRTSFNDVKPNIVTERVTSDHYSNPVDAASSFDFLMASQSSLPGAANFFEQHEERKVAGNIINHDQRSNYSQFGGDNVTGDQSFTHHHSPELQHDSYHLPYNGDDDVNHQFYDHQPNHQEFIETVLTDIDFAQPEGYNESNQQHDHFGNQYDSQAGPSIFRTVFQSSNFESQQFNTEISPADDAFNGDQNQIFALETMVSQLNNEITSLKATFSDTLHSKDLEFKLLMEEKEEIKRQWDLSGKDCQISINTPGEATMIQNDKDIRDSKLLDERDSLKDERLTFETESLLKTAELEQQFIANEKKSLEQQTIEETIINDRQNLQFERENFETEKKETQSKIVQDQQQIYEWQEFIGYEQARLEQVKVELQAEKDLIDERRKLTLQREESLGNSTQLQQILEQESLQIEQSRQALVDEKAKLALLADEYILKLKEVRQERENMESTILDLNNKQKQLKIDSLDLEQSREKHIAQEYHLSTEQARIEMREEELNSRESEHNRMKSTMAEQSQKIKQTEFELKHDRSVLDKEADLLKMQSQHLASDLALLRLEKDSLKERADQIEKESPKSQIPDPQYLLLLQQEIESNRIRLNDDTKNIEAARIELDKNVSDFEHAKFEFDNLKLEFDGKCQKLDHDQKNFHLVQQEVKNSSISANPSHVDSQLQEALSLINTFKNEMSLFQINHERIDLNQTEEQDQKNLKENKVINDTKQISPPAASSTIESVLNYILERMGGVEQRNELLTNDVSRLVSLMEFSYGTAEMQINASESKQYPLR